MNINNNNSLSHNQDQSVFDAELLRYRLRKLGKNQNYLSKVFKRTPARISQAFKGEANLLLSKISNHISLLESRS